MLQDFSVTEKDVKKSLLKLNPTKAPVSDGMQSHVLQETAEFISDSLTQIFSKSVLEGKVPDDWKLKVAHITAIF